MPSLRQALCDARARLESAQVPDAQVDAAWLVEAVTGKPRLTLPLDASELSPHQAEQLERLLARRGAGEPLQYILGEQYFYGLRFRVDARVLIPRPETELLCEQALLFLARRPDARVLDLCTGSGALAVTLAVHAPGAQVHACDISTDALALARENGAMHGAKVSFSQGDLLSPYAGERFDLIVSNPPYIVSADIAYLQREVLREPRLALDGGAGGLDFYRRIARQAPECLVQGGGLLLEVGALQAEPVQVLLKARGFTVSPTILDLRGIPRVVCAAWQPRI